MPSETNVAKAPGRWKRILKRVVLALCLLVVALALTGAGYEFFAERADARRFPQQGRSVALGPDFPNVSLNLDCSGQGSPTVILDSGLGVPAVGWKFVQPEVAKFTRVCSYDRAGYGWSTPGAEPRTSLEIVKELHALLAAAGEKGPYILVGHSFGGYNVRVYAGQYSSEVTGMVLVDASHEDQTERMSPAFKAYMKKETDALSWQKRIAPVLIHLGIARLSGGDEGDSKLPKDFVAETKYLELQPKFIVATASEMQTFSPESASEVRAAGNLGDRPLVVLTAGKEPDEKDLPKGLTKKDFEEFHGIWVNELQVREAQLSTRGKRIMVPDSTHMIPFERPDTVIAAIREVYGAATTMKPNGNTPVH